MRKKVFLLLLLLLSAYYYAAGQKVAFKTNLIYDATATVNVGAEIGLDSKWTLDVSGNLNSWSKDSYTKWKHLIVQPEARYWFCDRFSRHFIGFHLHGGIFNVGGINTVIPILKQPVHDLSENRYQGYLCGAGAAYGFAFILSRNFNLEFEAGFGYAYLDYEKYTCIGCGRKVGEGTAHYFGPTKAALNIVYLF